MQTKAIKTKLDGVLIVDIDVYSDERGFFMESYNERVFATAGLPSKFVQDNHSRSTKGVLRGIHYQAGENPMGKLVRCTLGRVLDVAVDLRAGSPTFGQYESLELSEDNRLQFYIPPGFGHGFVVLSDSADMQYKCTAFYDPEAEGGIIWNDEDLSIDWGIKDPLVSEKDSTAPTIKEYLKDPALIF